MTDETIVDDEALGETEKTVGGEDTLEAAAESTESSDDWRSTIKDEKARKFAGKFSSPAEAAESAYLARQQLSKAIVPPGDGADEDALNDYRKKLGVPESVDGYEVVAPEGLSEELTEVILESDEGKAALDRYRAIAHKHNITPAAFQDLVHENIGQFLEAQAGTTKSNEASVAAADADLKREWGKDFEANENFGAAAVRTFDTDGEFGKFLESTMVGDMQLGDHPAFRKTFAAIGRSMGEDGFHVTPGEGESQGIQEELDSLMGLMDTNMEKYKTKAVQNKIATLNGKLYGDAPIVGSQGRAA